MKLLKNFLALLLLVGVSGFQMVNGQQFRWELKVESPKDSGYHSIVLPPLSTCDIKPDLSDLRLYEEEGGKEVPFLLHSGKAGKNTKVFFDFETRSKTTPKSTELYIETGCRYQFGLLQVQIGTEGKFYRKTEVYNRSEVNGKEVLGLLTSNFTKSSTESYFIPMQEWGPKLMIRIYDEDNEPLSIDSIWASYPEKTLVAELNPDKSYVIRYGNEHIKAPKYDLRFFEAEIKAEERLMTLGAPEQIFQEKIVPEVKEEVVVEAEQPWYKSQVLIWIALILVVGLLGVMTLKMLKKSS